MKLLPTNKRVAIQRVIDNHSEWSVAMVLGKLVMHPKYCSTVERMITDNDGKEN